MVIGDSKIIHLASPRGFCAGVDRAVQIVEAALLKFGAPVYVRHEIVHNKYVVDSLAAKGAIFIDEVDEAPEGAAIIFSAHGVSKAVVAEAADRNMLSVDATCPLVTKIHIESHRHVRSGHHILLIGHAGHPEVEGTMGQVDSGMMTLIETADDARSVQPPEGQALAFATQTTLSVDDTAEIINILRARFPNIQSPHGEDICYATTNRQKAVKAISVDADLVLIIGAENSSNSQRLVEVAYRSGAAAACLIADETCLDWGLIDEAKRIGISAGASAPEVLVDAVIAAIGARHGATIHEVKVADEDLTFKLPTLLQD